MGSVNAVLHGDKNCIRYQRSSLSMLAVEGNQQWPLRVRLDRPSDVHLKAALALAAESMRLLGR